MKNAQALYVVVLGFRVMPTHNYLVMSFCYLFAASCLFMQAKVYVGRLEGS
jgi:hypothetical protein